jgi:hypothetical protein
VPEQRPYYTISTEEKDQLEVIIHIAPWLKAPHARGTAAGSIEWYFQGKKIGESLLVTESDIKKGSFFHNFIDFFEILFYNISHRDKDPWRIN